MASIAQLLSLGSSSVDSTNVAERNRQFARLVVAFQGLATAIGLSIIGSTTTSEGAAGNLIFKGTTTNDNAAAGNVGEYISATLAAGSAVALTTNVCSNVASISLTAGDWDVGGAVYFTGDGSTSVTRSLGSVTTTSATENVTAGNWSQLRTAADVAAAGTQRAQTIPGVRFSLAATTTVYIVATAEFTAGAFSAWGIIFARRVR